MAQDDKGYHTPKVTKPADFHLNLNHKKLGLTKIEELSSKNEGIFNELRSQRDWDKLGTNKSAKRYGANNNDNESLDDAKSWGTTKIKIQQIND